MDIRKRFGKRVKELRQAKGLTQEALAHLVEHDTSYISGIEKGESDISIEMIQKISIALQINISGLFEGLGLFEIP
ncbi:MAG TPA: helix-turn-helix transcriptional regulator [Puia sp.]|jgi:transcriptional regulator with XRE-family HTH domain|nr:helix-turn-helix transcriptional regulator [Puia sp.]